MICYTPRIGLRCISCGERAVDGRSLWGVELALGLVGGEEGWKGGRVVGMLALEVVRDRDEIMLQQHDVSGRMAGRLVYLLHSLFSARV